MTKLEVLERIRAVGIVPVLRASLPQHAHAIAQAIAEGGVTTVEVTMTVPNAISVIQTLVRDNPEILVGAGTVLDAETARICILEGAQFIVGPSTNLPTIQMCQRYSVPVLPGALTPTEIVTAWQAGADVVKLFPASAMGGSSYLRSLRAPLPHVEVIPTGGVSLANAREFLEAGAFALGVGADLVNVTTCSAEELKTITSTAAAYRNVIAEFRAGRVAT